MPAVFEFKGDEVYGQEQIFVVLGQVSHWQRVDGYTFSDNGQTPDIWTHLHMNNGQVITLRIPPDEVRHRLGFVNGGP